METSSHPVVGLGFLNGTNFVLIHAAIPSGTSIILMSTNQTAMQPAAFHQVVPLQVVLV